MSNSQHPISSPGPAGSVPGSRLRDDVRGDGHSTSAGRVSQRGIWRGQWIRAVGTIDLDLEIPGWGIMSAA